MSPAVTAKVRFLVESPGGADARHESRAVLVPNVPASDGIMGWERHTSVSTELLCFDVKVLLGVLLHTFTSRPKSEPTSVLRMVLVAA